MSATIKKIPPSYLREARIRAGYANRETASTAVPFSPETIGRHERGDVTDRPLPHATLRVSRLLEDGQAVADRLEEIAFDGVISQDERQDFEDVLVFLRKLEESITDIMLIGLGKGKAAPGATGSGQVRK